jgi:hypothetical protein
VPVKGFKFLALVVYIAYLIQVGMLMIWLPWSRIWDVLIVRLPLPVAWLLDSPFVRGAITAFGVLHLLMVLAELIHVGSVHNRRPESS